MGLIYCSNRSSQVFKVDITSNQFGKPPHVRMSYSVCHNFIYHYSIQITEWFGLKSNTAASPRHHPVNDKIIYLASQAFGPHHKEQKLVAINADGTIQQITPVTSETYMGMYNQSFPDRCWSTDGKFIFFSTPCKSSLQSYALHTGIFPISFNSRSNMIPIDIVF